MRVAPFPAVQQRMGQGDVMDVGRRRDQRVHQARVGIHPDVGLHAKVPLPGQMIVDGLEDHPGQTMILRRRNLSSVVASGAASRVRSMPTNRRTA